MPGLHMIQHFEPQAMGLYGQFQKAVAGLYSFSGYQRSIYLHTDAIILGVGAYSAYPIVFMEDQDHHLLIEGRLYNVSGPNLKAEMGKLGRMIFSTSLDAAFLRNWLESQDGEFILFFSHRQTGKTAVLNDIFGRLPLYYRYNSHSLSLARDIRFLYNQGQRPEVDRLSLAHFLMLGHGLGEKTVWQGIDVLTPGTLLLADPAKKQVSIQRLHEFNFSQMGHKDENVRGNAERLAEKFVTACRIRADNEMPNLVSLSGGLDSRAVAAGLAVAGMPFSTATFYQQGYTSQVEIRCAAKVAEQLKAPWQAIPLKGIRCSDSLELLGIKAGFSPLYMAFILTYFRELQCRYGFRVIHFTGDGGDQCLPALRPPIPMTHLKGLADYVIQDNFLGGRRLGLGLSAALTGFTPRDLRESLAAHLAAFPEKSLEGKWLHFQFYGIIVKIYFEAEDRNRCYFWSTSPFYSVPFYSDAIQCPQGQKSRFNLYRHFLAKLAPALGGIEYSGYHGPLGSARFYLKHAVKRMKFIRPAWTLYGKHLLKGPDKLPAQAVLFRILKQIMANRPALGAALDFTRLEHLIAHGQNWDRYHVFSLFSTLAMLELGLYGHSTLEDYPNVLLV